MQPPSRLVALSAALCALLGCATTSAPSELDGVRAELRAMREANGRLERRLERIETEQLVSRVNSKGAKPATTLPARGSELPDLTVVKLKPRQEEAPKVVTAVSVIEPDPALLDQLAEGAAQYSEKPLRLDGTEAEESPSASLFDEGMASLTTGDLEGGIAKLHKFADTNRSHPSADNALHNSGLGHMGRGDFERAARAFELTVTRYPAGDAVTEAMLKLAECRLKQNQKQDAKSVYSRVISMYPGTPAASQAEQRLAALGP